MGINEKEFIEVFIRALSNKSVIKKLQDAVCEPLQKEVNDLRIAIQAKDAKIDSLEKRVFDLELQIEDIEQYGRRNSLRIRISGIQETASENVKEKVSELINDTLQVTPKVMDQHIDRVHRVGKRGTGKTRAILVKFCCYGTRDLVIRSRGKLKNVNYGSKQDENSASDVSGTKERIYINEDLTKYRADLLFRAREFKREKKIEDCWSWDGKILIKNKVSKVILIRTVEDLEKEASKTY